MYVPNGAGWVRWADLLAHAPGAAGDEGQQAPQDGPQAHNGGQEREYTRRVQLPGRRHG